MKSTELLAVARIAKHTAVNGSYRFTFRGDGLRILIPPRSIWMYRPDAQISSKSGHKGQSMLNPAIEGLSPDAFIYNLKLNGLKLHHGGSGLVILQQMDGGQPDAETVIGNWICIEKSELERSELEKSEFRHAPSYGEKTESAENVAPYVYQLIGRNVHASLDGPVLARVVDYFETGAHGILITKTLTGSECLIPMREQTMQFDLDNNRIIMPNFTDYLI